MHELCKKQYNYYCAFLEGMQCVTVDFLDTEMLKTVVVTNIILSFVLQFY